MRRQAKNWSPRWRAGKLPVSAAHCCAYIVERGLDQHGYWAPQTRVDDYIEQAQELDAIPNASSRVRRDLELMAEEA